MADPEVVPGEMWVCQPADHWTSSPCLNLEDRRWRCRRPFLEPTVLHSHILGWNLANHNPDASYLQTLHVMGTVSLKKKVYLGEREKKKTALLQLRVQATLYTDLCTRISFTSLLVSLLPFNVSTEILRPLRIGCLLHPFSGN